MSCMELYFSLNLPNRVANANAMNCGSNKMTSNPVLLRPNAVQMATASSMIVYTPSI